MVASVCTARVASSGQTGIDRSRLAVDWLLNTDAWVGVLPCRVSPSVAQGGSRTWGAWHRRPAASIRRPAARMLSWRPPRRPRHRDRTNPGDSVAGFKRRDRCLIDIRLECRVEAVDHVAQPDRQADIHDLLRREMPCQIAVCRVVDRLQPGRFLRVSNDGGLRLVIDPRRQGIVVEVPQLIFRQPEAPTEHCVGGDSVIAVVDDGRGQVGEFACLGSALSRRDRPCWRAGKRRVRPPVCWPWRDRC